MKVLTLIPVGATLEFSLLLNKQPDPIAQGRIRGYRSRDNGRAAVEEIAGLCLESEFKGNPDAIAVRCAFGGTWFAGPAVVGPAVLEALEGMQGQAPLHIPALLELLKHCGQTFEDVPQVVAFETSFFADLPARECSYALDHTKPSAQSVRRYGFHGILHQEACTLASHRRSMSGANGPARIASICLEAQPELAAVIGYRPVMVTSGATPLEGIPRHTSCGNLDPSIVTALAEKKGWGPEQINTVLTQQSGLLGLVGRAVTFDELFSSEDEELTPVREIIQYRILQECGAAAAAMGGLNTVVFSGRYAEAGKTLGPWLISKLKAGLKDEINLELYPGSLERAVADSAVVALIQQRPARAS